MKNTRMITEHHRIWTLETGDFSENDVMFDGRSYALSDRGARMALLKDVTFCADAGVFGFPQHMVVGESDTSEVFDVEVIWTEQY